MKNHLITLLLVLSSPALVFSQDMKKGIEYKFNTSPVFQAKEIVWYGWDFSKSKMRDFGKFDQGELIKGKHIPAICAKMNERVSQKGIARALKKDSIILDLSSVQDLYEGIDAKKFITGNDYSFPIDSVKSLVQSYKLPQKDGVGFVVIVELMSKVTSSKRFITGYVTFFDIKTREVLYATKMKGLPGGKWGFNEYWENGVHELYLYFTPGYYEKALREYNKSIKNK